MDIATLIGILGAFGIVVAAMVTGGDVGGVCQRSLSADRSGGVVVFLLS